MKNRLRDIALTVQIKCRMCIVHCHRIYLSLLIIFLSKNALFVLLFIISDILEPHKILQMFTSLQEICEICSRQHSNWNCKLYFVLLSTISVSLDMLFSSLGWERESEKPSVRSSSTEE